LVDVAVLRRYEGGGVTRGEAVCRVVEADELGSTLGGKADLRSESGPQTLAAPPHLGRQPFDANLPPARRHLRPGEGDFRVDRPARLASAKPPAVRDREPVLPRPGGAQLLLDSRGVAPPKVLEGDHRPAQFG